MSELGTTPYSKRANILADLWMNYRLDTEFKDFIEYNDIGLPLSYFISEGIVESTPMAEKFINETFDILLKAMNVEDTGFETLDDLFEIVDSREEE